MDQMKAFRQKRSPLRKAGGDYPACLACILRISSSALCLEAEAKWIYTKNFKIMSETDYMYES